MAFKGPNITSQLLSQVGMGRPGGMPSKGSSPVPSTIGSNLAAMQNALMKKKRPPAKKLAPGSTARQFQKTAVDS